ncbi:ABC-type branched-chain amino acid transport system, ATPase component protein [Paramagnetospirillum caucaseum]|uniref:ABC-type branched-chain amino acid transport system, ATPase component protein n=1 Tax=Paramagnetospirillum caucaseum TaxID=1244869 RepID=M3A5D4_9PROT|nr:ABC transporter ATP-binding protein [Paramagnetospirillum caucaseum]EME68038.1 ABC-type branched-chain amino acid transport system, ATPase component protein [Paramagnetospirillum caucaseum]
MLNATGIHTYYGNAQVLHGIDFHVAEGETVALMGRNGMGKSTLLKSMLGIVAPRRGKVRVNGVDVTGHETSSIIRRGLSYVPEGRGMFHNLSVREHLLMAARPGIDGRRDWTFDRVLETFPRLAERLDNLGTHLSGGEQQMLSIGRALMTNPRLLILDEATEGLAPLIRRDIWHTIRAIKATGIASIIVDKNVNVLLDFADRGVILVKGEVVCDGPAKAIKQDKSTLSTHIGI